MITITDPFQPVVADKTPILNTIAPSVKKSYNFAAYVNESRTLQELLKLGVSLYDIENVHPKAANYILKLDFERDCVEHIKFLVANGLKERNLGRFITEFPFVFRTDIEDLQVRLDYLKFKNFTKSQIKKALNRSAHTICHKSKTIDHQLGLIQIEFNLPANSIRSMFTSYPPIISLPKEQYSLTNFVLSEEFGFVHGEILDILGMQPKILQIPRAYLIERLELIHNDLKFSHHTIARHPKLITGPKLDILHRAGYLKKLKRDQYDPRLPLYVNPKALYKISDRVFCRMCAKTSLDDYRLYVKTL